MTAAAAAVVPIRAADDLARVVGRRAEDGPMKDIDFLDEHCRAYIALASVVAVAACDLRTRSVALDLFGGEKGFVRVLDERRFEVAVDGGSDGGRLEAALASGGGVGTLFMAPGINETIRVNGSGVPVREALAAQGPTAHSFAPRLRISVEKAFLHCAKAFMRSHLWEPQWWSQPDLLPQGAQGPCLTTEMQSFVTASPFLLQATADVQGRTTVSPRGDPPGFVRILDERTVLLPDRPGNNRFDSFHNLLESPSITLCLLRPNSEYILRVAGRASITSDEALLATSAVDGRSPRAGTLVSVERADLCRSGALAAASPWTTGGILPRTAFAPVHRVFRDHIQLNRLAGERAARWRAEATEEAIAEYAERDYRENLY